jgi:hypothetical protein
VDLQDSPVDFVDSIDYFVAVVENQHLCIHSCGRGSHDHAFAVVGHAGELVEVGGPHQVEAIVDGRCKFLVQFGGGLGTGLAREDKSPGFEGQVFHGNKGGGCLLC